MASIALGLVIAIFFIAMAEGVYEQIVNEGVRMQAGHITLENPDYQTAPAIDLRIGSVEDIRERIKKNAAVEETKLLIWGQGVANSGAGAVGVSIMGVEPAVEIKNSPLARDIVAGSYLAENDDRKVVLGEHLAKELKLSLGNKIVITTNNARGGACGRTMPGQGYFPHRLRRDRRLPHSDSLEFCPKGFWTAGG